MTTSKGSGLYKNCDFLPIIKNSKKIIKIIKFSFLAYFDVNIKMSGSDRPFGHRKLRYRPHSTVFPCYAYYCSRTLYIYIYLFTDIYAHDIFTGNKPYIFIRGQLIT